MFLLAGEEGKVDRLVIGRTHYRVVSRPNRLTLKPVFGRDVWFDEKSLPKPSRSGLSQSFKKLPWIGSGTPLLQLATEQGPVLALVLTIGVIICLCIAIHHYRILKRRRMPLPQSLGRKLIVIFSCFFFAPLTVLLWRSHPVDTGYLLFLEWIAWSWATFLLFSSGRLRGAGGWLWIGALFLQCSGVLALTQLAVGADNTRWLNFANKHILLMSALAWAVVVLTLLPVSRIEKVIFGFTSERTGLMKGIRIFLASLALILLGAQALFGGERGLWGFQPADMAKLLFVVIAAFVGMHLTEVRRYHSAEYRKKPSKYIWDFMKVLLLVGVAVLAILVGVRDFSPMLIMVVLALAWIWRVAPHPWNTTPARRANRLAVLVVVMVIGISTFWIHETGEGLPNWVPMKHRFLAWAQPEKYPHSGEQASRALALAGQGQWTGAGASWFGLNGVGNTLPQVQNDFIVSFLLYKFGGIAGLALAFVQLLYLWVLFGICRKVSQWGESAGNYRQRQTGNVLSFIIFGLAWIHIGQWGISWGNAFGLLPVMGQPMTWISAANSHMVFVGFPALVLSLLSAWMTEEVYS
jgi:cell division protein FtsW (lipid II flippase)